MVISHGADLGIPVNGQATDPAPSPVMDSVVLEAARLYREVAVPSP